MSKNLIICDIDGTIANLEHRLHYLKSPKKDWASFNKACVDDEPYKDVIAILQSLVLGHGNGCNVCGAVEREFHFFSGRNEVVRKETEEWLKKHVPITEDRDWELHMRKEGDYRPDTTVKYEMMYELKITPDDVLCILDDRQGVVDMWRQEGFRCLQVDAWKEEPKRHHLMDDDLEELNKAELIFLVEHERKHFNIKTNVLMDKLIATESELKKRQSELGGGKSTGVNQPTVPTPPTLETPDKNLSEVKAQLSRVYYHSWITGPQGARFEIFKSNHSTEVINKTKSRLRYDQDVVKIYVVDGEPEDYDHKKERLEFYDIEEDNNG